jgi:hypothetical protein
MALTQSEGRDAEIDRTVRALIVHCGLLDDGQTQTEHTARAELAGRLLDAAGGESALDLNALPGDAATKAAFAAALLTLSLRKALT